MKRMKPSLLATVSVVIAALSFAPAYAGPKPSGGKMSVSSAGTIRHNAITPAFNRGSGAAARPSHQFGVAAGRPAPPVVRTPSGQKFVTPRNSVGPFPTVGRNGKPNGGVSFIGGKGAASSMRIMPPRQPTRSAPGYPKGYVKYTNRNNQAVNPSNGKTLSKRDGHKPIK